MTRHFVAIFTCILLVGCTHRVAPVVKYCLPPTAFLPIESANVRDASPDFAAAFCNILKAEFQAKYSKNCYSYLHDTQPRKLPPQTPPLASDAELSGYRIFLVSGFASACFHDALLYSEAAKHLAEQHGVKVENLDLVGLGSVDDEASQILVQLRSKAAEDTKKWIVLGFSKGAVDWETIVASTATKEPQIHDRIAALVTIAGMIGGSRLYDQVPNVEEVAKFGSHFPLWQCKPGVRDVRSLNRRERQDFLTANWRVLAQTPTYSLTTVSERSQTSRIMQPLWDSLSVYSVDQDGQMAQPEQIAPGASFLGTANADHWAVAISFPNDPIVRAAVDRNEFPREPLLEALLRFVVADLNHTTRK